MTDPITDETARQLRAAWFAFTDTLAGERPRLHAYCLKLTGSLWDADDLFQDTLLRGFGAIGRGDLHGPASRFRSPAAWLSQIATNLWIDRVRRRRRETLAPESPISDGVTEPPVVTPAVGRALFDRTSPQQRAAVVLKDVFDFTLEEIAEILTTTPGAVKSALSRSRAKLTEDAGGLPPRHAPASAELIDRFIAAFNARDVPAVVALLLEDAAWEVQGVGGERGRDTTWLTVERPAAVAAQRRRLEGVEAVAFVVAEGGQSLLVGLLRIEEAEGRIARIVNYHFSPETLAAAAEQLGLKPSPRLHHQERDDLARMIAGSGLPWEA